MKWGRLSNFPWRTAGILFLVSYFVYVALSLQRIIPLPFFIELGVGQVRMYAVCIFAAVTVGLIYLQRAKRRQSELKSLDLWDLALWVIVPGLLGARLLHVIEYLPVYAVDPTLVIAFWIGGLSILGGMIGGLAGAYVYSRHSKLNWNLLLRHLILIWPLVHLIGRAGNYFDRTLYGLPTNLPWAMYVDPNFRFLGFAETEFYHPVFLYEQILNLGLFLLLGILAKRGKSTGTLFKYYVLIYLTGRFMLDFWRLEPRFLPGLTFTQLIILLLFLFGLLFGWIWQLRWKLKYKEWWKPASK